MENKSYRQEISMVPTILAVQKFRRGNVRERSHLSRMFPDVPKRSQTFPNVKYN